MQRFFIVWGILVIILAGVFIAKAGWMNRLLADNTLLYQTSDKVPGSRLYPLTDWQSLLGTKDKGLFGELREQQQAVQQQLTDSADNMQKMEADLLLSALKANTWQALDGYQINIDVTRKPLAIPGFIVPIEVEDKQLSSFFIVPYYGACLHFPPPPPNQIIFVELQHSIKLPFINNAFLFRGMLKSELFEDPLGTSAWTMVVDDIHYYDGEADTLRLHQ